MSNGGIGIFPPAPAGAANAVRLGGRGGPHGLQRRQAPRRQPDGLVERLRRHPLALALRPDKLQLAALEETLRCLQEPGTLDRIPVWAMLRAEARRLRRRSERWADRLRWDGVPAELTSTEGAAGAAVLCLERPGGIVIDARCVLPGEDGSPLAALAAVLGPAK